MTIDELGSIGELIAAVATIATLAFLALQIRQSNKAERTNAELELPLKFAEWHARVYAQPELTRIWDVAAEDVEQLDPDEVRLFRWTIADLFLVFEAQYYAYRGGVLSEASWLAKRDTVLSLLQNPVLLEQWTSRFTPFSEEFRAEIDAHRGASDPRWKHQTVADRPDGALAPERPVR